VCKAGLLCTVLIISERDCPTDIIKLIVPRVKHFRSRLCFVDAPDKSLGLVGRPRNFFVTNELDAIHPDSDTVRFETVLDLQNSFAKFDINDATAIWFNRVS
jgi:hypothetical protein